MTREVVWDHGVSLPAHGLWLDPLVVRNFAFISHAHTDHARRHKEALLTPQTLALIPESRRPRGWRMLGYQETMHRGHATVTLYPAGHMLGSAQLLFEHDGTSLLYTGDIKLRQVGGAPPTCRSLISPVYRRLVPSCSKRRRAHPRTRPGGQGVPVAWPRCIVSW